MGNLSYRALSAEAKKNGYGSAPLPAGKYDAAVTGATFKPSKNGNPTYQVEFTVLDGEFKGRKAWKSLTITEASAGMFFRQMDALGLGDEFFAEVDDDDEEATDYICSELIDAQCVLVAGPPEDYQGRSQTRIKNIWPAADGVSARASRSASPDDEDGQPAPPRRASRRPAAVDPDEPEGDEEEDEAPAALPARPRRRRAEEEQPATGRRARPSLPPGV